MPLQIDANGLDIDTLDESLEGIIGELQTELSLTDAQVNRLRTNVSSSLGQLARQSAEREQQHQEALVAIYNTLSFDATGASLDRVVRLLGVTRLPARSSRVLADITGGNASVVIPDGTRYRYNPTGDVFTTDGAIMLDGSGEYVDLPLVAESTTAIEVALAPDADASDWTLLDVISHAGDLESTEQPIVGRPIEVDAALRVRAATEASRRGSGSRKAIDAAVQDVEGVTFVRTFDNPSPDVDANGIIAWGTNVVVEGGSDLDVANAIWSVHAAGSDLFGLDDASLVEQAIVDEYGFAQVVPFNRVSDVTIWIRITATTSTSEEIAPVDLEDVIIARILERGPVVFPIGTDVVVFKISAMLADLSGIDALTIALSIDGGGSDPFSSAKREISIRQKATFDEARIDVTIN
jgi:hypothetical protein